MKIEDLIKQMGEQGLHVQMGGYEIEAVPSGIASFDHSTGVGGFPRTRMSVVQGEEGSGKTLLALSAIAYCQHQLEEKAAFIDLEHALTPSFAQLLGVDYDALLISRPSTLNEAYDVTKALIKASLFSVVVFDSAVALATEEELGKSAREGSTRAGQAQVHSEELKKVISLLTKSRTAFLMINQLREDPNPPPWAKQKILYSPGGRAIRHHSSLTVDVSMRQPYKHGSQRIGHRTKTYVRKNKVAQPFLSAEFDMYYATGVDVVAEMVNTAIRVGIIEQKSSWFYFNEIDIDSGEILHEYKWNGRTAVDEAFKEDEEILAHLRERLGDIEDVTSTAEAGSWDEVD